MVTGDTPACHGADRQAQAQRHEQLGRHALADAALGEALTHARQAAHLYHALNAPKDESRALSLVAHLAALTGLTEEALESATLAVRLAETTPQGEHLVEALNYLGVAAMAVNAEHADAVLSRAEALAQDLLAPHAALRPLANRLLNELYRLEQGRQLGRSIQVRATLRATLDRLTRLVDALKAQPIGDGPAYADHLDCILHTARAGLFAFDGRPAQALAEAARIRLSNVPVWMHPFTQIVLARCELAAGRWTAALAITERTLAVAQTQGQLPFTLITHCQRLEAFGAQGDSARMLLEFHAFRAHQLQHQADSVVNRERVATLRLAWREQTRAMEVLHTSTRALEQLTREDPLTGLANRRALELCLDEMLSRHPDQPAVSWCLVMLDIDGFKQINDRHSHLLGDHVLRQMGELLREVVRTRDLAVRLAGDEFVLVLRDTTEAEGQCTVDRLLTAVEHHAWSELQPGLSVRVSVGLTQAQDGDTSTSLLLRSDMRMYADKASRLKAPR